MRSISDLGTKGEFIENQKLLYSFPLDPAEVEHSTSDLGRGSEVLTEVQDGAVGQITHVITSRPGRAFPKSGSTNWFLGKSRLNLDFPRSLLAPTGQSRMVDDGLVIRHFVSHHTVHNEIVHQFHWFITTIPKRIIGLVLSEVVGVYP